jgi:hypothetical protein
LALNWNRILSAKVCAIYCIIGFLGAGILGLTETIGITVIPVGIIWYADDIGSYVGGTFSGFINNPSPGWLIRILGWIFLFLPAAIIVYSMKFR